MTGYWCPQKDVQTLFETVTASLVYDSWLGQNAQLVIGSRKYPVCVRRAV
jgi:hypothetical protein